MVLGISEDFTSTVEFDSQLSSIPSSGLYLNSGTHPIITVNNLLEFLPNINFNFSEWDSSTSYGVLQKQGTKRTLFHTIL